MRLTVLTQEKFIATSADPGKYPTFKYDIATGEKKCTATTTASKKLGCARCTW